MQIFFPKAFVESFPILLPFLPFTLGILGCSLVFSLSFGMLFAWCKLRKNKVVRGIVNFYVQIIQGTPFIVLLFIMYFGIPKLFSYAFGVDIAGWNKAIYMVLTLSMFGSARMSEAMRSAYLAIPKGQMEAACSCGLSTTQGFFHVILPQALYIALPNLGNLIVSNLLETAVGFSVGVIDLVGNARNYNTRTYGVHILEVYLAIAIIYWLLSLLLAKLVEGGEKALGRRQGIAPVVRKAVSRKGQ
jgi:L-cystine transport system permease protein